MPKSPFDKVIALNSFKFVMIVVVVAIIVLFALWREPTMTLTFLAGCLAGGGFQTQSARSSDR